MANITYTVTVATGTPHPDSGNQNPTGNVYYIDGQELSSLSLTRGDVVRFSLADPSNQGHEFRVATGTNVYDTTYTPGFYVNGEAGQPGSYVEWTVPSDAPDDMYVYCVAHGLSMGFDLALSGTAGVAGTTYYTVTVDQNGILYPPPNTGSGHVFLFDGQRYFEFNGVERGHRYEFDFTDPSNVGHTFKLMVESVHDSGYFDINWTAGLTDNGGTAGVDLIVYWQAPSNVPEHLQYGCIEDGNDPSAGGLVTFVGLNGTYILNPDTGDANAGDLQNPTISDLIFGEDFYQGAIRYNTSLHSYEFFNKEFGWTKATFAPVVSSHTGQVVNGQPSNSITVYGGGFDENMTIQLVNINDKFNTLPNVVQWTYVSPTQFNAIIDAQTNPLQDGTGALIEALMFRITSGVTGAASISGEVELDRDPEFGAAPLTVLSTVSIIGPNGEGTADISNALILSAIDPDDEDAVIEFSVAPNTMAFGTNRNDPAHGGTVGTVPNPQNSDFSIYFEYQEPNQGILKGSIAGHSNGGPGHPDYGVNLGAGTAPNLRYPGTLQATHDMHIRATSTAPDGRITTKDETFKIRATMPWKHITNISHHYVLGGYIGAESWRVVQRCTASTDTTVSLGVKLASNGVTSPNSNRSGARYSSETVDRWSGTTMVLRSYSYGAAGDSDRYTENYNMITDSAYALQQLMSVNRHDLQGFTDDTRRKGYAHTGYNGSSVNATVDKINLVTGTREAILTNSTGRHGYGAATIFTEVKGYHSCSGRSGSGAADAGHYMTFANDTFFNGFDLYSLGLTGAVGKAITTWQNRNYWIGYNNTPTCWYCDTVTDTFGVSTMTHSNGGEGNCTSGLAWGYELGGYNGTQNNISSRFDYATETGSRVASADTTGNSGTSSAAVGWVEL